MVETKGQKEIEYLTINPRSGAPSDNNSIYVDSADGNRVKIKDNNGAERVLIGISVFNVLDYGGYNSTAIAAAITAAGTAGGGVVYCPSGTYTFSASVTCNYSNVTICGDGESTIFAQGAYGLNVGTVTASCSTQINANSSTGDNQFTVLDTTGMVAGQYVSISFLGIFRIKSVDSGTTFTIDEYSQNRIYTGASFAVISYSSITENVHIKNLKITGIAGSNHIRLNRGINLSVEQCFFELSGGIAVGINDCYGTIVRKCRFNCQDSIGIYIVQAPNHTTVENCLIENFSHSVGTSSVIDIRSGSNTTVKNCSIISADSGMTVGAISVNGYTGGNIIEGNSIDWLGTYGIFYDGNAGSPSNPENNMFINNKIQGPTYGIYMAEYGFRGAIIGNITARCGTDGIYYNDCDNFIIEHNNCPQGITAAGTNTGTIANNNITS